MRLITKLTKIVVFPFFLISISINLTKTFGTDPVSASAYHSISEYSFSDPRNTCNTARRCGNSTDNTSTMIDLDISSRRTISIPAGYVINPAPTNFVLNSLPSITPMPAINIVNIQPINWPKITPPHPTPTASPTPVPSSSPPIGIGISSNDVLDFYNTKALGTDIALAGSSSIAQLDLLKKTKGVKVLLLSPDSTKAAQEMDTAKTSGFLVSGNIEDPNLDNTLSKQKEQYQLAKSKGLTYIFGPAGIMLRDSYSAQDYSLARNSDILVYQTQYLQDNPREIGAGLNVNKYAQIVKDMIAKVRPYTRKKQVWVQVSVNPPANRCMSSEKVIRYIDSLINDQVNGPNAIMIFYSTSAASSTCQTSRTQVMQEVFSHYRPGI